MVLSGPPPAPLTTRASRTTGAASSTPIGPTGMLCSLWGRGVEGAARHCVAESQRAHVRPHRGDVSQTFRLRRYRPHPGPARSVLAVTWPHRVLTLVVDNNRVGRFLSGADAFRTLALPGRLRPRGRRGAWG